MFRKILIANRGEIACRVIRTARRMGITTIAVYSEADVRALHVQLADEKIAIGPAPATQSYLDIDRIIEACRETGAEAVHPGYGFLSERAAFARALASAGIAFIGPHSAAIDAMGDKIASKEAAIAAGVATVPGHIGIVEDENHAVVIAEGIGYPVMMKASAGGGGKGMRVARSSEEVLEGFTRAASEAQASFGDGRMFIEKFIENPRHIEIQVLGDKHGNIIHLGERECSIQRRNQKVIEEAPSPLLDAKTRRAMGEQAVALAKAVNYDSAGTVEFVVGQDRQFYFLEMNTRLQVEHPVTELVTGIDLVEQMIRVAAGDKLPIKQTDVRIQGWAIEGRVCAEDPYRDDAPSTGRLIAFRPPPERTRDGLTMRCDTGVYEGGEVSVWYDSLIAKLCTHSATRDQAIDGIAQGLDEFSIEGIKTNIPFLSAVMANGRWREGRLSTGFIIEEFPQGLAARKLPPETKLRLAVIACMADHVENRRRRRISGQMRGREVQFARERCVRVGKDWLDITIIHEAENVVQLMLPGASQAIGVASAWTPGTSVWIGFVDGVEVAAQLASSGNGYAIAHRGFSVQAHVYARREAELAKLMPARSAVGQSKAMHCPMPGLIIALHAAPGTELKAGDPVAVIEAMKMQNTLRAERDGVVAKVRVAAGDSISLDAVILEFA
jgi:propionyl-CoA carboxylase alpha chain